MIVIVWPLAILALSSSSCPPPPVAVYCPASWQVVSVVSLGRKWPAVPATSAVPLHVPDFAFVAPLAAAISRSAAPCCSNSVPASACTWSDGWAPVRMSRYGAVPMVVSIASSSALRAATLSYQRHRFILPRLMLTDACRSMGR